jgi:hypothetical protein
MKRNKFGEYVLTCGCSVGRYYPDDGRKTNDGWWVHPSDARHDAHAEDWKIEEPLGEWHRSRTEAVKWHKCGLSS